jgi:hypothetical protein
MNSTFLTPYAHATNEDRFAYVLDTLGAVSPFGDEIGESVSKPQLAIALSKVETLRDEYQRLFSHAGDAYERLSKDLPYGHPLLVNLRSSLGLHHY